jgi:hypothetical protein
MDERITHLRATTMPDAAGLVLASDQDDARAYAKIVQRITGEKPALILSDDPKASKKIEAFRTSKERIAVCVRMISEGVDVPRAACLAWMTSYRTPLFFAQAVGRVVRARNPAESATVFLPAVRPLLALAAEMELDRNFVMMPPKKDTEPGDDLADPLDMPVVESEPDGIKRNEHLESDAEFAHLLSSGRAVVATAPGPASDEEEDFLGLPGLLTPEQTAALLTRRDSELRRRVRAVQSEALPTEAVPEVSASQEGWRAAAALRREVNQLVSQVAARTGAPHAKVHIQLRTAVPGPVSASASVEILELRRDHLLGML